MSRFYVDKDITVAKTIHTDLYRDEKVYNQLLDTVFGNGFHLAGDTEHISGDCLVYPFILLEGSLDEPLVLLRDKNGSIKCLSNVCTHRGNLLVTEAGKISQLRCKYHGRTFSLDGEVVFMPEFKEVIGFPCKEDNLHQMKMFQWGKLIFISLNQESDGRLYFHDMMQRMAFFPMDKLKRRDDLSKEYAVDCNWALYCENYLEGFHIPFVHAGLSEVLDFGDYETELYYPYSSLQLGVSKTAEGTFDLPTSSPDFGRNIAAYYFWVFPNMMFNFYPWGLSVNIVQPMGVSKTKVTFITYVCDESKMEKGAGVELDKVEMEDEEIVQNVQKGVKSRFYNKGRYSVKRERGTHHFHCLLAKHIPPDE